jgi:hypothetical protein
MPYDPYALILAQRDRDRQIDSAAEHRRHMWHRASVARRPVLRPVGRLFVRLGHALGGDVEPTAFQPARTR